jgi:hypothetical protein
MDQLASDLGHPVELRVLTGPNLYFARPAVKLTLDASGVLGAEPADVVGWQRALRVRNPTVGLPDSPARANRRRRAGRGGCPACGRHHRHPGRRGGQAR